MATVRSAAWRVDEESGKETFHVDVEYLGGDDMPDWPIAVIWKATPVAVVVKDEQTGDSK